MTVDSGLLTRTTEWLFEGLPAAAPQWLMQQRWFGGKSRSISRIDVDDVLWLPVEPPHALVIFDVAYGAGAVPSDRYALVAGLNGPGASASAIASLPGPEGLLVTEATADAPAILGLLRGLCTDVPVGGSRGGEITFADATNKVKRLLTPDAREAPAVVSVGREQSNTSLRLGATHVFKLFRRLEEGQSPQLEIGRFLARTNFRAAPMLEGSLTYRAADGQSFTLGVVEAWVDNQGDGWSYVIAQLQQAARAGGSLEALAKEMFLLGTITADFHAAMASLPDAEGFAPSPVTVADTESWCTGLRLQAERSIALVEQQVSQWSEEAAALGRGLLQVRPAVERLLLAPDGWPHEEFQKIRIHGDYHLGQTLKAATGFVLIDFEGEPSRSLAARREKQCALRDVAGMLRSLEYATETVRATPEDGRPASGLQDAFVEGYRARTVAGAARFVPSNPEALASWIAFFELEKALYEIEYEANNRPSWVHIPLRGVLRLLQDVSIQ